jgi:hypothetical protein
MAEPQAPDAVAAYKRVLGDVIDRRPSGTRRRLALALGKNRSFVSQIASPAYAVPIPAAHLDLIFEVCRFSPEERRRFIAAYRLAHPNRPSPAHAARRVKAHTVYLPDLGDDDRNTRLHTLTSDFVRRLAKLLEEEQHEGKGR